MKILFTQEAWKDFEWFQNKDKRLAKRKNNFCMTSYVILKMASESPKG